MEWYQTVLLAIIQGVTEFLPISSSAHLVIPSMVLGWPDQGLAFDVAVHVGTLAAVLLYYRRDISRMTVGWFRTLGGGPATAESRLVWYLMLATMPAGLVGLLGKDFIEAHARTLPVIAATTLLFGLLLAVADRASRRQNQSLAITWRSAALIGLAQAISPIPGVSRSGITITAGLLLGLERQEAARFSFLLSIPIIVGAGAVYIAELATGDSPVAWGVLIGAAALSGVTAYLTIAAFLRLLERVGLMPFVYYRVALAGLLFALWLIR